MSKTDQKNGQAQAENTAQKQHDLKPCPFCGGKAYDGANSIEIIYCDSCGAMGPSTVTHGMNADDVRAAWNNRKPGEA